MTKRRVVITGLGAVSPFGVGVDKLWNSLVEGKSGISTSESIDISKHVVKISGEVKDFDPEQYLDPKESKRMDRFIQFAMVAADEAIADAKLEEVHDVDPYRIGVMVSSAAGGFRTFEENHKRILEKGPNKCSPFTIPMMIVNMPSGRISIKYGYKGVNKVVVSACATGTHTIGDAFRTIQYGDADIVIAGGTEATICDVGIGAFASARTLSHRNDEPEKASRPFDKDRDGFVMSEGAGVLVLEEYEHAKKRGAKIYAEVVGYGMSGDAYHITAPSGDGAYRAMKMAADHAREHGVELSDIGYINAHGTSTPAGDVGEAMAVKRLFGDEGIKKVSMSSTKSAIGHLLGAAGAVEAVYTIMAIQTQTCPPTLNLDNPEEELADFDLVPLKPKQREIKAAMSNSFGFGGTNSSVIFKKI